jgi:hypothetical protein
VFQKCAALLLGDGLGRTRRNKVSRKELPLQASAFVVNSPARDFNCAELCIIDNTLELNPTATSDECKPMGMQQMLEFGVSFSMNYNQKQTVQFTL